MEGLAVFTLAGLSKRVNWKNTNLETLLEGKIHLESSTTSSVKELRRQCMKPLLGLKGHLKLFFGSMESMIEVLLDVYKHLKFSPMFDYTRAWITSRYELIFGLKNTEITHSLQPAMLETTNLPESSLDGSIYAAIL